MDESEYEAVGKCVDCGCPLLDPSQWAEGFFDAFSDVGPARTLYSVRCPVCGRSLTSTPEIGQSPETIVWQKPIAGGE
jgi:hypothetical protein